MGRVLLVVGDAADLLDVFYPLGRVREDGHEAIVAGPTRRPYHLVLRDRADGWDVPREAAGCRLAADAAFAEVRPDEFHGLVLPGGRAPEYLRYDADLMRVVRSFFFRDLPVACLGAGVEILAAAGVLRGRTVTTAPTCQFDAEGGGAAYVDQPAVVCGNLVTGRTHLDHPALMREFMKMLERVAPARGGP